MKKQIIIVLVLLMILGSSSIVFAGENEEQKLGQNKSTIMLRWVSVDKVRASLTVKGVQAQLKSDISLMNKKADKVVFQIELQQYTKNKWKPIKTFSQTANVIENKASFSKTSKISKNYKYRFIGNAEVYKSGDLIESIKINSNEILY